MRSILCLLTVAVSVPAFADAPPIATVPGLFPLCQLSYRSDSYGRGLEAGYKGGDLRPKMLDEQCYRLGVEKARLTRKDTVSSDPSQCMPQFDAGYVEGLVHSPFGAGVPCYVEGYQAGVAFLDVGARECRVDLVGQECVLEYRRGWNDSKFNAVQQPGYDAKLATCYETGYFDFTLTRQ